MDCGIWPSVISGLVGGGLALLGVYFTLKGHRQRDKDRQEEIIRGILQAIYEELKAMYDLLDSSAVELSWKAFENGPHPYYNFAIIFSKDYSIVFRSNANFIGQIKNSNIRHEIVKVYKVLDVIMGEYEKNTELLVRYIKADKTGQRELASELYKQLRDFAPELQEMHEFSKKSIRNFLYMLEEEEEKESAKCSSERFWEQ
ncbi:MAG: hypothetical protein OXK19_04200 [Candidatus Dadabacteria bacterium]|nr:hypothetical protein [Candidatus Dadabacteria bacterium]